MVKRLFTVLATILAIVMIGSTVFLYAAGGPVYVSWNANSESDLAGYKIYYDLDSGPPYNGAFAAEGASPIDIPLSSLADPANPIFTLNIANDGSVFGAVTAYDSNGNESGYSNEDGTTIDTIPAPPTGCAFSTTPP